MASKRIEICDNEELSRSFALEIDRTHEIAIRLNSTSGGTVASLKDSCLCLESLSAEKDLKRYFAYRNGARQAMMLLSMLSKKGRAAISEGATYLISLSTIFGLEITFTRQGARPAVTVASSRIGFTEQIKTQVKRSNFAWSERVTIASLFHILSGDTGE